MVYIIESGSAPIRALEINAPESKLDFSQKSPDADKPL